MGIVGVILLLLWGLNMMIVRGYSGAVMLDIYESDQDTSAIFWTDV